MIDYRDKNNGGYHMSETINHNSESLAALPSENQWEQLSSVPFNNEQQEQADPAETESTPRPAETVGLQVLETTETEEAYRPIGEMEPGEIAREYMDLLHDLSDNFTSPEAIHSAVVTEDGAVRDRRGYSGDEAFIKNIYKKNGLELDDTNNFNELRENGQNALAELHYENADLDRAHTLKMVDEILSGEQAWRDAGEQYAEAQTTLTSAVEKLNQLQEEQKSKGFFGRLTTALSFRKQTKEINDIIAKAQADLSRAERNSQNGNRTLAGSLEAAYSPDYHYGHHKLNYEHNRDESYKDQINEEYNNKFFGADDPARQEKINRALELRKALQK